MKTVVLRLLVILMLFTLGTQTTIAQRKSQKVKQEQIEVVLPKDTVAIYKGDFKDEFLTNFFKESGKIVFNGKEFKFVLSLLLSDTGTVEEVIVIGVDSSNVKLRMQTIAENLNNWSPEIK